MINTLRDAFWIVLISRPAKAIRARVEAFLNQSGNDATPIWEIVETEQGSAIFCREPGSEGGLDLDFAQWLSEVEDEVVALLWPQSDGVFEYESGTRRKKNARSFAVWLCEYGMEPTTYEPLPAITNTIAVFLGLAASALEGKYPQGGPIQISEGPAGAILRHAEGAGGVVALMIARQLDTPVDLICVTRGPEVPFSAALYRNDEVVGAFGTPTPATVNAPTMESVAGNGIRRVS